MENDPVLAFGLGESKVIDRVAISWPGGGADVWENLAADRLYTLKESGAKAAPAVVTPTLFTLDEKQPLNSIVHGDPDFDDYLRQPLLPWKHSRMGPGMAWADVNGDGSDDLYLSQAVRSEGRVYLSVGGGKYEYRSTKPFEEHRASEDMAPLFFDAEGDGDVDLYVVSGSVECDKDAAVLQDRLYLNDGKGSFATAGPLVLPEERISGSCAVAADYDRDGDLDLFVGGRIIPGAWPEVPASLLLRNDSRRGEAKVHRHCRGQWMDSNWPVW